MFSHFQSPIICIMGPTASGKTSLALELAKVLPIEIISVDSAQIYQGLDIGSGKPSLSVRNEIPHHLMDCLDPKIPYSAAQFRQDALKLIQDIRLRNKVPLLVGGTMLYFRILQQGVATLPDRDEKIRANIEAKAQQIGWENMHELLSKCDPLRAQQIKPNDKQRIQRALEIFEITGQPMSYWLEQPNPPLDLEFINIGLMPITTPRQRLHHAIEQRFKDMLAQGFIDEVTLLKARGDLDICMPSMRAVGYRQAWQYLQNEITFNEMKDKAIAATRQLAKRQLTWMRQWPSLMAYDFLDPMLPKVAHQLIAKHVCAPQFAALS